MVLYLTLILGLICAGVAVGHNSWSDERNQEHEDNQDNRELVRMLSDSLRSTEKQECEECLRTTLKLIEKALDARKHEENFWAHDSCKDFPEVEKGICYNMIDYLKASSLNIMETRVLCLKASYCHPKGYNIRPKPTVGPKVKQMRHHIKTTTTPKPHHLESPMRADVESTTLEKFNLQLQKLKPQYCDDCKTIIDNMKDLLHENWFFPSIVISVCDSFPRRPSCYEMVYANQPVISTLLEMVKTPDICIAIKWCEKTQDYPYCKACQKLLYYGPDLENEGYYWENYACNYLEGQEKENCVQALDKRKGRLIQYMDHDYPSYDTCVAVGLCEDN